jgi:hypothetical protein
MIKWDGGRRYIQVEETDMGLVDKYVAIHRIGDEMDQNSEEYDTLLTSLDTLWYSMTVEQRNQALTKITNKV